MDEFRRNLLSFFKAVLVLMGFLLIAYNWAATFLDLPPIIKDWRWGLGVGLLLFVVGALWYIYDLYRKYVWWVEPLITLSPQCKTEFLLGRNVNYAILEVGNRENIEITDCFATLIEAVNLYGENLDPVNIVEKGYLRWKENSDCPIVILPKDERSVEVASDGAGFGFSFCKSAHRGSDLMGLYSPVTIRIDGKLNGKNIKPQFFNGYLFIRSCLKNGKVGLEPEMGASRWISKTNNGKW